MHTATRATSRNEFQEAVTMSSTEGSTSAPRPVDEERDAAEQSRQRIARTLDRLEERIVEEKHEPGGTELLRSISDRVRDRPLTALAIAAGVGALLGAIGGRDRHYRELEDDERAEPSARRGRHRSTRADFDDEQWPPRHSAGSAAFAAIRAQLIGAATTAIAAAITSRVADRARRNAQDHQGEDGPDDEQVDLRE
jgi:ElaB/YqjD/DUF883 family membrane-anchored ribosome-binding protein